MHLDKALRQTEEEIIELLAFCKTHKMSNEKIAQIFSKQMQIKRNIKLKLCACVLLILAIYLLSYLEIISWHLTAIGRILMIKFLQIYDWQKLKHETCLIRNELTVNLPQIDCYYCEYLEQEVAFVEHFDAGDLKTQFLDVDRPVIFKYDTYPKGDLIENLLNDDLYAETYPCNLASNLLRRSELQISNVLKLTYKYDAFFMHFMNCHLDGVKLFRRHVKRPEFFVDEVSPVQYSWLLISRRYNTTNLKRLELKESFSAVWQLNGSNLFELRPLTECEYDCDTFQVMLHEGDVLFITSAWDLAYRPDFSDNMNVAVILEAH